jgi:hypothetical protein
MRTIRQFPSSEPVDARAIKGMRLFTGAGVLILFSWFLYFSLSTLAIPYQIEYREGAAQVMTQIFLEGGNPFSLEYQPLGMNNYGVGYSLAALPFAKLFGNTLMVHRGVSLLFLLGTLLLVAGTLFKLRREAWASLLGGVFIVVVLAGRGGLGAFPSSMGAFLFLAAILIPFLYSFSLPSLIASALLSLAAFYTKPYFAISFGIVAAYTFAFVSKRRGILYCLFFLLAFPLLFLGVRYGFKLYFIDTIVSNLSNARQSSDHLRDQLVQLAVEFYPVILLGIMLFFLNTPDSWRGDPLREDASPRSKWDAPLFRTPIHYFAFVFILCLLAFLLVLGHHKGTNMIYAYHLVLPPYILWLFSLPRSKNRFSLVAVCLAFGNILILYNLLLNPSFLRQVDSQEWAGLREHIRASNRVVNSPAVASMLIDAGVTPVDSGQTEYYYNIKPYPANDWIGPAYETVQRNGIAYRRSVLNAVRHHKFDKVILTDGERNLLSAELIAPYYIKVETFTVEMPQTRQTWVIEVWEPLRK